MPTYLMENEVDFATDVVGFPGIGSCMGMVLQTRNGMFGYHVPPGSEDRSRGFAQFVKQHAHYGEMIGMYTGCRFQVRWNGGGGAQKWREEVKYMATMIGYQGMIWGFDMTSPGTGITAAAEDNAYIEFKLKAGRDTPTIKVALMSDMNTDRQTVPQASTSIRKVWTVGKIGYELKLPYSKDAGMSRITAGMTKRPNVSKHTATGMSGFHHIYHR
jgi:hypothetical protein